MSKLKVCYGINRKLHYISTSHGKGLNDGLRGNVKRMAHRLVMTCKNIITNATTFADAIRSLETEIHVVVMNEDDINSRCLEMDCEALWKCLQTLQGTITIHSLEPVNKDTLRLRYFTDSDSVHFREVSIRFARAMNN